MVASTPRVGALFTTALVSAQVVPTETLLQLASCLPNMLIAVDDYGGGVDEVRHISLTGNVLAITGFEADELLAVGLLFAGCVTKLK